MRPALVTALAAIVLWAAGQSHCPPTIVVTEWQPAPSSSASSTPGSTLSTSPTIPPVTSSASSPGLTSSSTSHSRQMITVTETRVTTHTQIVYSTIGQAKNNTIQKIVVKTFTTVYEHYVSASDDWIRARVTSTSCPGASTITITLVQSGPLSPPPSPTDSGLSLPTYSSTADTIISTASVSLSSNNSDFSSIISSSSAIGAYMPGLPEDTDLWPVPMPTENPVPTRVPGGSTDTYGPTFWSKPTPTLTIKPDGRYQLPCFDFQSSWTFTLNPPDYTTTLCKPHCGDIQFKLSTIVPRSKTEMTNFCYPSASATAAGTFSAIPLYATAPSEILVPVGWDRCLPKHVQNANQGNKGYCGPGPIGKNYQCKKESCCGLQNHCGRGKDFCDAGCQPNWGYCWKNSSSCAAPPEAPTDDGAMHNVTIFPVWYDAPKPEPPFPWPPVYVIEHHGGAADDAGCHFCPPGWLLEFSFGIEGICGWIGCDGWDLGWFKIRLPNLKCNWILKFICRTLHLPCCPGEARDWDSNSDCNAPICDDPGPGPNIDGNGKLCPPEDMEKCDPNPSASGTATPSGECDTTSTVTDKTIHCDLTTNSAGKSSETCTSTQEVPRAGCPPIEPKITSVTTTACETTTAEHTSVFCSVQTGGAGSNATLSQSCSSTTKTVSGCSVTNSITSETTIGCSTATAVVSSVSCMVKTGANATTTTCPTTAYTTITGCDASDSVTTDMTTTCSIYNTVTDVTKSCFGHDSTVSPTVINGVTSTTGITCTATATSVHSGCDISASTSTAVSFSELVCTASERPYIQVVPEQPDGQWPITFGLNATTSGAAATSPQYDPTNPIESNSASSESLSSSESFGSSSSSETSSSITCAPPSVSSLPACTPMVNSMYNEPITEVPVATETGSHTAGAALMITTISSLPGIIARQEAPPSTTGEDEGPGTGQTVTTGSISCLCDFSAGENFVSQVVWPISTCSVLLCPNLATTTQEAEPATVDSSGNLLAAATSARATETPPAEMKRAAGRMSDAGPFLGMGRWLKGLAKW